MSMIHRILVEPEGQGWKVHCETLETSLVFVSGAEAEAEARRLGEALADQGGFAEIRIILRDGALAGRYLCAPSAVEWPADAEQPHAWTAPRTPPVVEAEAEAAP